MPIKRSSGGRSALAICLARFTEPPLRISSPSNLLPFPSNRDRLGSSGSISSGKSTVVASNYPIVDSRDPADEIDIEKRKPSRGYFD